MAFFEELKKSFSDVTDTIAKKSGEIVEVQKLKMKKSGLESDIKKNYIQLGRIYFHQMEESGVIDEVSEEFFQSIVEAKESIEEIKVKLEEMSKEKTCTVCGEKSPKSMAFCPHCGTKFENSEKEDSDACADESEEMTEDEEVTAACETPDGTEAKSAATQDSDAESIEAEGQGAEGTEAGDTEAGDTASIRKKAEAAVESVCERAEDAAESARDKAEEVMENAREKAGEVAEIARKKAAEAAENAREKAVEAAEIAREKAAEVTVNVCEKVKEAADHVCEKVKK